MIKRLGLVGQLGLFSLVGLSGLLAALATSVSAQTLENSSLRLPNYEVPIAIARPAGAGPFPPVLYIHAKRGFEDEDRAHLRELAAQGFLVVAPEVGLRHAAR